MGAPRRSKRWFRIVQHDGDPNDDDEHDEQRTEEQVLAVDCSRTDALRLTTVARAGGEDDDHASMHEQAEAVWRLTACGRLVNRRLEAHGLVLDSAPMRRFVRCDGEEMESSAWRPAMAVKGDVDDAHAATQVRHPTRTSSLCLPRRKESRSHGRDAPKLAKTILSWPHERTSSAPWSSPPSLQRLLSAWQNNVR
jgi:hypothetical protein